MITCMHLLPLSLIRIAHKAISAHHLPPLFSLRDGGSSSYRSGTQWWCNAQQADQDAWTAGSWWQLDTQLQTSPQPQTQYTPAPP